MPRKSRNKSKKRMGYVTLSSVLRAILLHKEGKLTPPLDPYKLRDQGIPEWNIFILYHALEDLDLVRNGQPTETFDRLALAYEVDPTTYRKLLSELLQRVYSDVFRRFNGNVTTATQEQLIVAFAGYDFPKQHRKMVALFKGLCREAGLFLEADKVSRASSIDDMGEHTPDDETPEDHQDIVITTVEEGTPMQTIAEGKPNNASSRPLRFSAIVGQVDVLQRLVQMPESPQWTEDLNEWWQDNFRTTVQSLLRLVEEKS